MRQWMEDKIERLEKELANQKAITELAVKMFTEIATSKTAEVITLRVKAGVAISEIERIRNAQT